MTTSKPRSLDGPYSRCACEGCDGSGYYWQHYGPGHYDFDAESCGCESHQSDTIPVPSPLEVCSNPVFRDQWDFDLEGGIENFILKTLLLGPKSRKDLEASLGIFLTDDEMALVGTCILSLLNDGKISLPDDGDMVGITLYITRPMTS